ncbi:odorant receptor 22c-like isoform X2 [Linepithema humile]|uniref:odorant receptor 22c-like isoform X2 n=1 Tax=Linepithema humile TaxID=83485 RepID=UPI00351E4ED6
MISRNYLQFSLNRIFLLTVGLWPYQQSKLVRLQLTIFFSILITFIIFQLTTFLTSKCTMDLFANVFSSVLLFTFFIIKYCSFSLNNNVVKYLLEQMTYICDQLTDENEINIIKRYNSYGKYYTIVFMLFVVFIGFSLILYLFWPFIANILLSINETRTHAELPLLTEYFVDQDKYFYLIILHTTAASFIGGIAMLSTGTILLVCQQYACGMFRIACYRIEQAMTICKLRKNYEKKSLRNELSIYKGLIYAVDMHREAMKFCDSLISKFKVMFFFLIVTSVLCTTLSFFRIFQVMSFGYNIQELLLPLLYVIILVIYMVISNYVSQEIMDRNNDVIITVYNVQWYLAPLHVQKMILFLLQKGTKAFTLNLGTLFVGSLESAAMLLSTSLSYFTVLYSTQH